MDVKKSQRIYIFYRTQLGSTAKEIHEDLVKVHGPGALSYATVTRWKNAFDDGKMDVDDEPRSGRPLTGGIDEIILEQLCLDPHISAVHISCITGIPRTTVNDHLKKLGWENHNTKWVPHILTDDQKKKRVEDAKGLLALWKKNSRTTLVVSGDESWLYFDNPYDEMWVEPGGSPEKKAKITYTNRKLMISVFFSRLGIEYMEFMPENRTINADYFCGVLKSMRERICER